MVLRRLNLLKRENYSCFIDSPFVSLSFSARATTMNASHSRLNPFFLMLEPEVVISAMESSTALRGLRQRICRPLDKPLIPKTHTINRIALRDFDAMIDEEEFMDSGTGAYVHAQPALQLAVH
ncbi:MAG: hypothetical protein ACI9M6_001374 [Hydrogenophaga sp.]|jgi:hypothetical protein